MAENSEISWTDHTFNPWMGCTKVSPACANCYAENMMDTRYGKVEWGPRGTRVLTAPANWRKPLKWNREAELAGVRKRVFCASLADVFEDWSGPLINAKGDRMFWGHPGCDHDMKDEFTPESHTAGDEPLITLDNARRKLFALIDATPHLDWLLLTKRPENILRMWPLTPGIPNTCRNGWDRTTQLMLRPNVWLGTSVENEEQAEERITSLLQCRDLAPVLFLSCEPLLGSLENVRTVGCPSCGKSEQSWFPNFTTCQACGVQVASPPQGIDWIIAGGESGTNARQSDPEWFRSLRDLCSVHEVAFHFKQWGEWDENGNRVGKKKAGRLLDGVTHDAFPEVEVAS